MPWYYWFLLADVSTSYFVFRGRKIIGFWYKNMKKCFFCYLFGHILLCRWTIWPGMWSKRVLKKGISAQLHEKVATGNNTHPNRRHTFSSTTRLVRSGCNTALTPRGCHEVYGTSIIFTSQLTPVDSTEKAWHHFTLNRKPVPGLPRVQPGFRSLCYSVNVLH